MLQKSKCSFLRSIKPQFLHFFFLITSSTLSPHTVHRLGLIGRIKQTKPRGNTAIFFSISVVNTRVQPVCMRMEGAERRYQLTWEAYDDAYEGRGHRRGPSGPLFTVGCFMSPWMGLTWSSYPCACKARGSRRHIQDFFIIKNKELRASLVRTLRSGLWRRVAA